ncbi:hypothetical protein JAAARDRAFT_204453 [Jaapia argillacea MUCL 33604]|uniref:NAD-dependent epimerase/dehydratase domain-containing protein n=1 Tax=Jaapia argillacea MUCL 33604 TaxID=933084 RepID=A0A067Q0L1_9AGAM|nr:hypothetical protein JAAARDRAFT_204453 [Jaapia argillacea MUCL 33604]
MSIFPPKPTAIILGGLNTYSRALAAHLVPVQGQPLVSHLRIVDKFSVSPPTCYIGAEFPKVLTQPIVEYRQANLTVTATVSSVFDPPAGRDQYSYVFDFTGEPRHDRHEDVQIASTLNVARLVGQEAARRRVKAYVRLQLPFYNTPEKGSHEEKEDIKPVGAHGIWWHETLRTLAAIASLNLVVVRAGYIYGPYLDFGLFPAVMACAATYGFVNQPLKVLWSPGKFPVNTVHIDDVVGSLWACASWMAHLGRVQADSIAGEVIHFHNDKSRIKDLEGVAPHDSKIVAPLFNIVDDSNTTFISWVNSVAALFGTTTEYFDLMHRTLAKFMMEEIAEEINGEHVGIWTTMITTSDPPVSNTPLSPYIDARMLDKHVVGLNNGKIKSVVGYRLQRPQFGQVALREMVDKWKVEGTWPIQATL